MKRCIFNIITLLILTSAGELMAQQLPVYSQYVMNGLMINPAMAGHDGYTSFNTTARQQWLGFGEAPRTYSASWQTRVLRKSYKIINRPVKNNRLKASTKGRVGLGAYLVNDVNANVARTGAAFTYAYHIFLNNQQLSFGLTGKAFQYRLDAENLSFGKAGDPVMNGDLRTVAYSPDADAGVFFRDPNYFLGFSISNLLQTALRVGGSKIAGFETFRHYWIMGGYRFTLSDNMDLEPITLLKTTENWNPQGDFTLKLHYDDQFWGGLAYRTNQSLIVLFGVRVDNLYFGYSFDWAFSEIGHFNYGSHEINLSIKLGDNARRYKWLNRY